MLRTSKGDPIANIDQWTRPKREHQWKAGRSAMELASAWFRSGACACPRELAALLDSHELTRGWKLDEGCPEFVTALPERGEGRNHDLWLRGRSTGGPLTVCVEAKVDESFGNPIGEAIAAALHENPRSGLPNRIKTLLRMLLGENCDPEAPPWRDLRYQLVTACAGTALQASQDASRIGVVVVQEFTGPSVDINAQQRNAADLKMFVREVFPGGQELSDGVLVGPRLLPRSAELIADVQLLIGKIRSTIAS
jgi:hypothetical protein